jgi:hypothetical protein
VSSLALLVAAFAVSGLQAGSMAGFTPASRTDADHPAVPPAFPDAYKLPSEEGAVARVPGVVPDGLTHPCSGMAARPEFAGLSPIAIAYPYTNCPSTSMMGDVATWQYGGHDFVGLSGFDYRMFFIYNVDDPYNPVLLWNQAKPSGGSASLSIFDWKQNGNQYVSVTMRGSGTGCGFFVYNVNDAANPQFVTRFTGSDYCTIHEHFVSLDDSGNADYGWFAMSGEAGSGDKIVAVDLRNLSNIHEVNRYERPDGASFIHDSNVVRGKLYVGHWAGGVEVFDKADFVDGGTPVPLNPIDGIRPSNFWVHHVVPTSDDRYVLAQDEFINTPGQGKVKLYDIQNLGAPAFVADITGGDTSAEGSQAHNMIIKPLSAGRDLLLNAWYRAGIRGFVIDTNANPPTVTQVFRHQLSASAGQGFGNVWGVDWLPCTLRGLQRTCMYAGDMKYGLVVNAVNTDTFQPEPALDPYVPEVAITSHTPGQVIQGCTATISGTSDDYWSGLQRVEVSTDGGTTWNVATGTTSWSYQWTIPANQQFTHDYMLKARAYDQGNNVAMSTGIPVASTCTSAGPAAGSK